MSLRYIGSGPYYYADSLAMVLGALGQDAPDPSAIEVLTSSPFGAALEGGLLRFSPRGWTPEAGLEAALDLLGWVCERTSGDEPAAAVERLGAATAGGPVLAGPVEMGLLPHQPEATRPVGADHFVVVTGLEDGSVRFHDPYGIPHATLPVDDFVTAWRAESIGYPTAPFTMRSAFTRVRRVDVSTALRHSTSVARRWLDAGAAEGGAEPEGAGSSALADGTAAQQFALVVEAGLEPWQRDHLVRFAVRAGARRLADASDWLAEIAKTTAAEIADRQARLLGSLQYPLVTDDRATAAAILRHLAPTYEQLREALPAADLVRG